ncbi:hypothetical protein [Paraflavitalea speifideaquila]|uniref:hypothetical protein n=1 Tax=Paraflavitalea speifideaquila TaxID=3076558 RepID=UPI0028EC611B|nr:hypothetical protein [Paraflavitalea speifideiaquila]
MKYFLLMLVAALGIGNVRAQELSLAGNWKVSLASPDAPAHSIHLPGTLDDAGIGTKIQ